MKKLLLIALFVQLAVSGYSQSWTQKADFPGGTRYGSTSLTLDDKIYVGLGTNFSTYYSDWWQYDSSNDTWIQKASFPGGGRYISTGIAVNGKAYVGLGITGGFPFPTDWWEYDPATDVWTPKAGFPEEGRYGTSNFELNGKGYVALGNLGTASGPYTKQLWEYNPATDKWKKKAKFPAPARYGGTGFSLNGKGYAGLGGILSNSGKYTFYKDFYEYDPTTDTWLQKADFPNRRTFPATFVLGAKAYVGFGQKQGLKYYSDFYAYDPTSDVWLSKISFPGDGRFIPAGAAVNGKGYSGTGYNTITGLFYSDWWEFSPAERLSSENSAGQFPQLIVYPNPANQEISLSLANVEETVSAVRIADITGKIVKEIKEVGADQIITIDISDLNSGIYFINALTSAGWRIGKFEVQK